MVSFSSSISFLVVGIFLTSCIPTATSQSTGNQPERLCNGLASNCDKRVNEIMYATVHNAMSSQEDGFFLGYNNKKTMEDALDEGFRAFLIDSCDCPSRGIQLCHALCVGGTKEPTDAFQRIVQFLENNVMEIVILEIQVEDDSLNGLWEKTTQKFQNYLYSHPGTDTEWPTLNELIDLDQRLIVFQHDGPDCKVPGECPDGVHNFFDYAFQTEYNFRGANALNQYESSCDRKSGLLSNSFMLINHFAKGRLGLPSESESILANSYQSLQGRVEGCAEITGRTANFLAIDFWSEGATLEIVNDYNLLLDEDNGPTATLPPVPSPTPAPESNDSGGMGCFSGEMSVLEETRGVIMMKELQLGDRVLVESSMNGVEIKENIFEEVYSFGHLSHEITMDYYQFLPSMLELSWNHLVFLEGETAPIPAELVRVGDILRGGKGPVTKIRRVTRRGVYAPLTNSGIILVNGIRASTYIAYQASGYLHIGNMKTPFSFHWLSHAFEAPHRLYCLEIGANCQNEKYAETGISTWVDQPVKATVWMLKQNSLVMSLLMIPFVVCIIAAMTVSEFLVWTCSPVAVLLLFVVIGVTASRRQQFSCRRKHQGNTESMNKLL
mmetsp:Transcript_13348/g.19221  ORF Transcript_13348/g.19221 Transcript_13348/m.19221 type:complete len:609 (+) Transcript_13348:145-1971(+)